LDIPFTLDIQTQMQVAWMLEFGHNRTFPVDATFGTNVQRYHLSIVIMFDHHWQHLPMAWVITSRQMEVNLIQWLLPLKE